MVYKFVKPTSVCTIQRQWQKFSGGACKVLDLNCCYLEESIEARHYKTLVVVGRVVVSVAADRVGACCCCCCCCSVAAREEKQKSTETCKGDPPPLIVCTLWPTRTQAMRDSTVVKLRAFLNLKGAHKGDGSKEAKYRNKLQKKKTLQTDKQTSEREEEEEEEEEEETDQNLPVIMAPKLSSFAQLKKQTNIQTRRVFQRKDETRAR
jgi:hypothetical protein